MGMNRMIASILAGGKGKRMGILCQVRAKPALPFAGKLRMIDFNLSNSMHSYINDIAIFVDYQRDQLIDYVKQWKQENSTNCRLDILEPKNNSYVGTANALYQHIDYLERHPADKVLVMPSDHVYKMDYRKMLAFHERSKADVTLGVVTVKMEEAFRFGILSTDSKSRVLDYVEKPTSPKSNLASIGIYIFNKNVLIKRLMEDAAKPDSIHDLAYPLTEEIVKQDRLYAYKYDGYWRDIGSIEAYYAANMELVDTKDPISFKNARSISTCNNSTYSLNTIPDDCVVNSIISPGCVIKGRVENSVLSPGVRVDEHAVIKNSVLLSNVSVGQFSVVESCIADEDVNIGMLSFVGFRNGRASPSNITVLGKGVTIPAHTAIAQGCRLEPYSRPAIPITTTIPAEYNHNETTRHTVLVQ
jgi:glucose-1-phosphate adenylyltransferase